MRILVVEDNESLSRTLSNILTHQNYAVESTANSHEILELVAAFDYDLILLDVMLSGIDGIEICRKIRSQGLKMPILLLAAQDNGHDKAIGLDAGADDYVVQPVDEEELVARVRALLRRGGSGSQPILEWGELRLDPSSCEVSYKTKSLFLTPKEYALLELFMRNNRRVFSCGTILEHLWSYEETPGEDAVRTHIKGLRQKLKAAGVARDAIETVYGIGYRLKPWEKAKRDTSVLAADPKTSLTRIGEPTQQHTWSLVGQVWHRFKERVREQVSLLEQAIMALCQQELDQDLQQTAMREAHSLAGALGTFGLSEGSHLARRIERVLETDRPLSMDETVSLQKWAIALRQEVERSPFVPEPTPPIDPEDERPLLLIVDGGRALTTHLVEEAATWGFRTATATNLAQARSQIHCKWPDIVLLDPEIEAIAADSLSLLADLNKQVPPIPTVILTDSHNLADRLEIARLGGRIVLQKSTPAAQMLEALTHILHQADRAKAKVMVVDDDPKILAVLRSLLEPWGLKVTTLDDPQQFWDVFEATIPDLLVLDMEMPVIGGIELCQIVRNDLRWYSLPILLLTARTDADIVNQVFGVGADDFASKPIVGPELVSRIINRLERTQFLRNLAETDPLTQLTNRQKSTQDLDRFLHLAQRQKQPFCLAVLDLDQFKQVNDRYGHATGDGVLRQFGQLLRQTFRTEDVVARWGGEEFVIGMYSMTKENGVQRVKQVLETLRQQRFTTAVTRSSPFQVTFSAGVAQYPEDGEDLSALYQAADLALYRAKATGRDRVEPVNS
jgi:diguanylate cyclase (GGDEF)-like protein